ncbi:MAG: hypothetical protein Q6363_000485, partial [Candidatus Njordarchaeota archaeon]
MENIGIFLIKMVAAGIHETKEMKKSYRLMFSFPSTGRLLLVLVFQMFAIFVFQTKIFLVSQQQIILSYMLLVASYLAVSSLLLIPKSLHVFTLKRMVGFLNVLTGVIIFVYLMFFVLSDPAIIILGAIAFLEYVTLSSIIDLRLTY